MTHLIRLLELIMYGIIGYALTSVIILGALSFVRNLDRTNREVSKWINRWILCPNHLGDPIGMIIKSWIWDYPHDFSMENSKLVCAKCGFRGLYLIGGIYDRRMRLMEVSL